MTPTAHPYPEAGQKAQAPSCTPPVYPATACERRRSKTAATQSRPPRMMISRAHRRRRRYPLTVTVGWIILRLEPRHPAGSTIQVSSSQREDGTILFFSFLFIKLMAAILIHGSFGCA